MTIAHDLHMARLRIARLEGENRWLKMRLGMRGDWSREALPLSEVVKLLASCPRPAPDPCEAEMKKEPRADEGQTRG